tara:strand:- start:1064 stop:1600 length:537 start_codon:yes stop_codon:yes gene_type:complete
MCKKQTNKGFTLIELLVVVAIIGIISAVGTVAYSGYTSAAKKSVIKNNHATINKLVIAELTMCMIDSDKEVLKLQDDTYIDCYDVYGNLDVTTVNAHIIKYVKTNYSNVFNTKMNVANRGQMHDSSCVNFGTNENNFHEIGTHTLAIMKYGDNDPFFIIDSCIAVGEKPLRNKTILNN